MSWFLYVIRCADDTLYTGITTDVSRRLAEHNSGRGAKYTRGRGPVQLLRVREYPNRSAATVAELLFKRLKRADKLRMLESEELWNVI